MPQAVAPSLASIEPRGSAVDLLLEPTPARLRISAPADGVLRFQLAPEGTVWEPPAGLVELPGSPTPITAERNGVILRLTTHHLVAEAGLPPDTQTLRLVIYDTAGRRLTGPVGLFPWWVPGGATGIRMGLDPATMVLGLGEKMGGLNRRGRRYTFWNTDVLPHLPDTDPLYLSVPWWITLEPDPEGPVATGWFVLAPGRCSLDVGSDDPDRIELAVEGALDLFVVAGPHIGAVLERFTALTGRAPLPPRWALGYHHSRWGYGSAEQVLDCSRQFRERKIPCDALYLDIDHMDGYRVFTWDPARFPDPHAFCKRLQDDGFRVVTIVDPGVKADGTFALYREGLEGDHFVRLPSGQPYHGDVWPGRCAFPDFFRPATRAWWGEWLRRHVGCGVAGIWNDMNEPAVFTPRGTSTFPGEVLHEDQSGRVWPHAAVHNLYGLMMARATWEALAGAPPDGVTAKMPRPFILTRSGFAGIQRYAAVWTGDNHSWWEHLAAMIPMLAGMGLSGIPFVGVDVGGFAGDCEPELLARWMQAAALVPLFRNHSAWDTRPQEPWAFGQRVEAIVRRAIGLRYRLLPYLYACFEESHRTGAPVLRPLAFQYPHDVQALRVEDQYLVGADVLVAPVIQRGAEHRLVYFPQGEWVALPSGQRHRGPARQVVAAPLETLPVYARATAVLPLWPVAPHTGAADRTVLELEVMGHEGTPDEAVRVLYDDDGETFGYLAGRWSRTRVCHGRVAANDGAGDTYLVEIGPSEGSYPRPWRDLLVRLHLPTTFHRRQVAAVVASGRELAFQPGWVVRSGLSPDELEIGAPRPEGDGWAWDAKGRLMIIRVRDACDSVRITIRFS